MYASSLFSFFILYNIFDFIFSNMSVMHSPKSRNRLQKQRLFLCVFSILTNPNYNYQINVSLIKLTVLYSRNSMQNYLECCNAVLIPTPHLQFYFNANDRKFQNSNIQCYQTLLKISPWTPTLIPLDLAYSPSIPRPKKVALSAIWFNISGVVMSV